MKSGLSTIQQTLTPDASAVLAASVVEAVRRNHGQTTPLHVAAVLLASPSGFLRNACVRSHPNSSHPLRSRVLDLCFNVALERLPATVHAGSIETETRGAGPQPGGPATPVSNALMAALKRAQAHQRRGCPEQQQQPLLAVKVELEQLVISILDDPSVSRVMREARFSSPAVKAAIEQSLLSHLPHAPPLNAYLNPRFEQGNFVKLGIFGNDEMKRISDIFSRLKKRNPILVGGDEPMSIMNDLRMKLKEGKLLDNPEVIQLAKYLVDKARLNDNLRDLGELIEAEIGDRGVVVDLGDLKAVVEAGRVAVDDVAKIVARFGDGRLWLIGTATCETYLRCQINYPSMENDWDLQAVRIATRSPFPGIFSSSMKTFEMPNVIPRRVLEIVDSTRTSRRCPQCSENYEKELAKFVANEFEKSSLEIRSELAQPSLPQWLQNAKSDNRRDSRPLDQSKTKDQEIVFDQETKELEKKWSDTCLRVHPNFHNNFGSQSVKPPTTLYNPKLLLHQPLQQKSPPNKALGASLQLNSCPNINNIPEKSNSPPRCPVRTDLVLGRPKITEMPQESTEEDGVMDLLGCISSYPVEKYAKVLDTDSYERLLKGLMEKVWWQKDAASKVAYAVTKPKVGDGKRSGTLSKGDTWILFTGPDKVGQKKIASVISDHICGSNPIVICLGSKRSDEEIAMNFRGKTVLDRIVEAVKRNPFSVIMLEDIDEADIIIRGSIKRAMERGRLSDSYGREISLGNVLFILTANWLPDNFGKLRSDRNLDESKIASFSKSGWQLRLRVSEKRPKRRPDWLHERVIKPRRELGSGLSLDLNLMADFDDDLTNGSPNSSDLTTEHGDDPIRWPSITSVPIELANIIDEAVVFKPVEIDYVKNEIQKKIIEKFSDVIEDISLEVEENALEKILGGVWLGRTGLEEWGEKVLIPSFHKIKTLLPLDHNIVIRLEIDNVSGIRNVGDWLPSCIRV